MTEADRELMIRELNVIINCAGSTEFGNTLDSAVKINVSGPLKLLKLAEECKNFLGMCHVSTCYAVADRDGVIEEKIHDTVPINWKQTYTQILQMDKRDLEHYEKSLLGNFPNTYTFTKRMAEHLLDQMNGKRIPLSIVRPSIIGASLEEPFPGWTDSITLAGGIYLVAGLGILRELPGDQNMIGDQVPVDIVANQILLTIPLAHLQA